MQHWFAWEEHLDSGFFDDISPEGVGQSGEETGAVNMLGLSVNGYNVGPFVLVHTIIRVSFSRYRSLGTDANELQVLIAACPCSG